MKHINKDEVGNEGGGEVLGGSLFDLRGVLWRRPGRDWHCVMFDLIPNMNKVNNRSDEIRKKEGKQPMPKNLHSALRDHLEGRAKWRKLDQRYCGINSAHDPG